MKNIKFASFGILVISFFLGCTSNKAELGSASNPIKIFFVPSVDVKSIEDSSKIIKDYLEKSTNLHFKIAIPTSYIAVVEALGTQRADLAALNTFGYILAHEKYGARAVLTVVRHGQSTYQGEFLARSSGPIQKIEDLNGKKVAFVDAASASGYLLPLKMLHDRGIKPKEQAFAMRHDGVVSMIYQGQVDAGAAFYSPPFDGAIQDARMLVKTQYPDIEAKVKIVALTDPLPNDPIIVRKDFPKNFEDLIVSKLTEFIHTAEGKDAFNKLYSVSDLKIATDKDYDKVRELLVSLGKSADSLVK